MKNIGNYIIFSALLLLGACTKDGLWNQDGQVSDAQKGRIAGQLMNDDDGQPLKGVKILFERQSGAKGEQTYVDTVSTDTEGKFAYQIPFPNRVRLSIRDTERYAEDEVIVEVLEHTEYNVTMNSFPKFGVSSMEVAVLDAGSMPMVGEGERLKVGLFVREAASDDYSLVEDKVLDSEGRATFDDVAFPVQYKVELIGNEYAYDLTSEEGSLLTKDPLQVTLQTARHYDTGDFTFVGRYVFTDETAANTPIKILTKSVFDEDFVEHDVTLDANGQVTLPQMDYPSTVRLEPQASMVYPFRNIEVIVTDENISEPFHLEFYDLFGRYIDLTPSANIVENTVVAYYEGVDIMEMEVDSEGNIYAVTKTGELIRIPFDGSGHKVLATGFTSPWGIAVQDDYTLYVVENSDGHRVKKVVIDPETDEASVSLFAGSGSSGTADGIGENAEFNRPSDAVYDPSRGCLWLVEWSGARIRKIDVQTGEVSTLATGTGYGLGVGLTSDYKYLYIASHTSPNGVVKYDIENEQMYTVRTGYSIRHIAVAPNDDVYFNINRYQAKVYKITNEVLFEGNGGNTSSSFETIAGNGFWVGEGGSLPPIGWQGPADNTIAETNEDGSPNGLCYDANTGRLYFAVAADQRLYYVTLTSNL